MSTADTTVRQGLLSVLIATLIITAGCTGLLADEGEDNGAGTPTATPSPANSTSRTDGADLRTAQIPDNGSVTVSGELDRGDPSSGSKYYEPVQVGAAEGQVVNITMESTNGHPELRVVTPGGNVTRVISNESGSTARFTADRFTQTGRYTLEATSVNRNATFDYTLTIERAPKEPAKTDENDALFAGPLSEWNETERYLEFGQDFVSAANATADNGQFYSHVGEGGLRASAEDDYLIITYQWDAENLNLSQMVDVDVAKQLTYKNALDTYKNGLGSSPEYPENESWVPEVIYFRAENPQGELYRTVFLTREWAQEYLDTQDGRQFSGRYYSTNRIGPGSPSYDPTGSDSVYTTDGEFPLGTYLNYTHDDGQTHAEKYYSGNISGTADDS